MKIAIEQVDYRDNTQAEQLVGLLNDYAKDAMGGGEPLPEFVKSNLAVALQDVPGAVSFICYVEGEPAGFINCIPGFSTFKCKPLLNIHDLAVNKKFRGLGLSQKLLAAAEQTARDRGCCKVTLEVLSGNDVAKNSYRKFGFADYQLDEKAGTALFWQKDL
ncbi:GNAT family N-acetyltransferase [Reinekea marinisedimentorum]|uniref:Acetyltransferase (GNAT) family protein n=1 Tax=Reinekea marinisedimentorum TaxID=230495 RepID=A0A4R3IC54_9GAMM|nr:GNAT family N-acetyltransferase [Reinekea marinisedimentorum]TCS43136.1 acetyltransferase (GNAT) family protein [Reinekea marinisedimentorum]